jgi:hypothetical protein
MNDQIPEDDRGPVALLPGLFCFRLAFAAVTADMET